ncbi:uncharacterized protein LOC127794173 [Diospyros lotus]|uniref:uncharacterized protein LOC127794173 n=1 Tax=Diospyros lotus TaxID=55363 RepID=UPI00224D535C|nr:uncharacterized protein LOC127794173 [Diospyros lotus]
MSSVMGDRDFLLDHEQLRSLAKVMYYQEAEAIHNTNFKSEDELAHYLSHSKSNYQSVIGLLDSASDAATKFQSAAAPASDAATPADAAPTAAAWHRANVDYACYIVNTLNVAFQHVKDFNVRFYYVRKLRKHCKSLESRQIEMQPLIPSQPPAGEDNVPGPAGEQTSPGEVPSPSDRVPDGGPDTKTAPAEETEGPIELDKLLDGEHGETMEVLPETNVAEELANLRTASQEYANAAINRAPGSTIDISEFHKQLERARVSLGYEKPFLELKNGQKLKVFNKILEENKVIKVLDGVGKVANAGLLLLTVVLIAWDLSAAPPEQRGTKLARESLVALGAYLAPEAVSAVSSAVLDAAGVEVAGFAVALGVSEVVLSAVAIGTGIGIGILAGLAVGWIFDAIYNYESSYPLTTEGHKVFVVPKPDVKALARRTAIQCNYNPSQ